MARTAWVTGAAAGIGRACALRLAAEGHAVGVLDLCGFSRFSLSGDGAAEWLRGKPVSERAVELGYQVGIFLVAGLMILALYNDVARLMS